MMTTRDKIHVFFLVLALGYWNPITFWLLYRDAPIAQIRAVPMFFAAVAGLGLLAVFLFKKGRIGPRLGNVAFSLSMVGIFSAFLIALDAMLPALGLGKPGLIFEPGTQVKLKTVEFESTATINSLGLRDREIPVDKGDKYRVLCFGDSWTFGWGVSIEDSWPRQLENFLKEHGHPNAEVIDCGQSGSHTGVYKKHVWRAVPVLKPDLVLVGVLQGDDLAQLSEDANTTGFGGEGFFQRKWTAAKDAAREFFRYVFKNTLRLTGGRVMLNENIADQWRESVAACVPRFDARRKASYEALPDTLRSLFASGNLNAVLIEHYIDHPNRLIDANDPASPATAWAAGKMTQDFAEMAAVCRANGAKLVFVNLPFSNYVGHEVVRNAADSLNTFLQNHNRIDSIYRAAAETNGLPYNEHVTYTRACQGAPNGGP